MQQTQQKPSDLSRHRRCSVGLYWRVGGKGDATAPHYASDDPLYTYIPHVRVLLVLLGDGLFKFGRGDGCSPLPCLSSIGRGPKKSDVMLQCCKKMLYSCIMCSITPFLLS